MPCVFRRPKGCAEFSLGGGRDGQGEEGNVLGMLGDNLSVDIQYFSSLVLDMKQTPSGLTQIPCTPSAVPSPQGRSSALAGKVCDRAPLLGLCWVLIWG